MSNLHCPCSPWLEGNVSFVYILSQAAAEVGFEPRSAELVPAAFTAGTAVAPQAALWLIPPA